MIRDVAGLESHAIQIVTAAQHRGLDLDGLPRLLLAQTGMEAQIEIDTQLPLVDGSHSGSVRLRERWERHGRGWQLSGYTYELDDPEREIHLAHHFHDVEAFVRRYRLAAHAHRQAGGLPCLAAPAPDAAVAIDWLVAAWMDPAPVLPEPLG